MSNVPPKSQKDTIYLEPDDDITAIVEKVESAENKVVALVLPKRAASLQSIVNMRLLKRNADKAGKSVVLITSEDSLLPLAGAAKIHVAKNLQSKPEVPLAPRGAKETGEKEAEIPEDLAGTAEDVPTTLDYHRSVGALAVIADEESVELGDVADGEDADKSKKTKKSRENKIKIPNFDRFRLLLVLGIVGLIALIVVLVMALRVWPSATITIQTESIPVDTKFALTTSDSAKEYNAEKKVIPIATKTSEQTSVQSVTATGQQNNGEKATGSVTMTAQACAPNLSTPSAVPAGTGVSVNGLTFITQSSTGFSFVSASGSCINYEAVSSTQVRAQSGGSKYNIAAGSSFTVAGRGDVEATGSATTGGTDNITTIVSQADLDKAKEKVTTESADTFARKFQADLTKAGEYVLPSTLKVGEAAVTSTPAVGQPGNTVSVTIKIPHTIFTVKKVHLEEAVKKQALSQVNTKKQKLETDDVLTGANIVDQNGPTPNDVIINIDQTLSAIPILDAEAIKKQIAGLKSAGIKSQISKLTGVKTVEVKMRPFYVSKVPTKSSKVTIVVKAEKPVIKKEPAKNNEP